MERGRSVYINPKIHKRFKKEANEKEITLISVVEEALLYWLQRGKKEALKEQKAIKDKFAEEQLKRELEEINKELEEVRGRRGNG